MIFGWNAHRIAEAIDVRVPLPYPIDMPEARLVTVT
jgi:hypothetical protein